MVFPKKKKGGLVHLVTQTNSTSAPPQDSRQALVRCGPCERALQQTVKESSGVEPIKLVTVTVHQVHS